MRDLEFEEDPFWQSTHAPPQRQPGKGSNATLAVMVMAIVATMVAVRAYMPENASGASPLAGVAPRTTPSEEADSRQPRQTRPNSWVSWLTNRLPGDKPLHVKTDFARRLSDWVGGTSGWGVEAGAVRPGKLRLWKPTLETKDYELQFRVGIERRGLGWAFRARDAQNYYASKIVLTRPGEMSGASIVRYGVSGAKVFSQLELPLPLILHQEQWYNITALVKGNRFTTLIDGHVIDEWTDARLKTGGVGFFADDGEAGKIEWAEFREQKGWLSQWLSAALFLPPGSLVP